MDIADDAQEVIERGLALTLARNRAHFEGPNVDLANCLKCGCEIPQARRAAVHSCKYCVHCQTRLEKQ
ncbi:conjugal transfer protein TraR [Pseudoalteromonas rubra]|uniref:Conjugal transfer protein TraR n=1 Tax=Pseudoalteromonas rubra TaxID=43658 RepID=A0A5S3WL07_9GAMM|nr:TraR/DksA C4-type zinc finger protein [Pseudoalteromonas rubra]TMP27190.1 conjugal transfer protein TraR [Pseudoalteromonas rubra]TMP29486.1 conjugal transfer protein TraR [Pseudoalteromonas rubra]